MSDWQPIETAPRDGTEVLLHQSRWVTIGCFDPDDNSWWCVEGGEIEPDHWQPLPAPPSEGEQQ